MSPVADLIDELDLPRAEAAMEKLLRMGKATARLIQVNKDGSRIPYEYTGAVAKDSAGNPMHVIVIGRDISERIRAEKQQEELAVAKERNRLARDLHDSVTQTLYSVSLYGDAAHLALSAGNVDMIGEHLDALRSLVWEAMREMRILLFELRPPLLEKVGLAGALQTRIESVETRTGSAVHFTTEGDGQLPAAVEAEVYCVALEALNNVVKHAQATNVDVHLTVDEARCTLLVQDNGIGFSPAVARHSGGYGLRNMQERIAKVNGRLTLDTEAGSGTTITIEVDL